MEVVRMSQDFETGITVAIDDSSQIGEARRTATAVALAAGLTETDAGKLALIATEAATNITKHATRGEIMLRSIAGQGLRAVDLIAIDSGPGITDLDRALTDGYSTAGSPGHGLGAMARLATDFDIFTGAGVGTVLAARVESRRGPAPPQAAFDIGVVRVPKRGEPECGDAWGVVSDDGGRATFTVADGLGHGSFAAEASRRAVELAGEHPAERPAAVVAAIHAALRATRGAAVAVAEVTEDATMVRFAGLGNIAAALVGPTASKSLVSHNGIAGHEMRKIQEFTYDWPPGALLVMHSDGISTRWDLERYRGLAQRHPSVVAGVIYRDFSRGRDDALIVVVRPTARHGTRPRE
jgi:anti-sigma regulatory factor (Ser/Thr protein kinase)